MQAGLLVLMPGTRRGVNTDASFSPFILCQLYDAILFKAKAVTCFQHSLWMSDSSPGYFFFLMVMRALLLIIDVSAKSNKANSNQHRLSFSLPIELWWKSR